MRIGELSKLSNVTIDTIRYYIAKGLLIPQKKGIQFEFPQREIENLQYIQRLKSMRFSIHEIETVMALKRTSNWIEAETIREYTRMLLKKAEELSSECRALSYSGDLIEDELRRFEHRKIRSDYSCGVPVRALSFLVCPHCKRRLAVNNGSFAYKYIYSGLLSCASCGYKAVIEDGAVLTERRYENHYDKADTKRELYQTLCSNLIKLYQQASDSIQADLHRESLAGKVILENFVNGYFYLYTHFNELPADCLYVVIDKYPETISMYKELISSLGLDLDVLYIADASLEYPLMDGCVDVIVDFFSSTEHDLYFKGRYYEAMNPYLKADACVLGVMMDMNVNAKSRQLFAGKYPEGSSELMRYKLTEKELIKQGFAVENHLLGAVWKTQDQFIFSCHLNNEELRFIYFKGKRNRHI